MNWIGLLISLLKLATVFVCILLVFIVLHILHFTTGTIRPAGGFSQRDVYANVVTSFRIAVARPKGSTQEADFFTIEVWRRLAETCAQYLRRGREVAIEGRLDQRTWQTTSDDPRERVIIVARTVRFLRNGTSAASDETLAGSRDDDIPF